MFTRRPSPKTPDSPERYRAGRLQVDVQARRVSRDGAEIRLTDLTFDVLAVLLRRAPATVSKKTLLKEVWRGTVVEPDTVKKRIALLREALGDDDPDAPLIRVVRGRGYSIAQRVERPGHRGLSESLGNWRLPAIAAGIAVLPLAAFLAVTLGPDGGEHEQKPDHISRATIENSDGDDSAERPLPSAEIGSVDPIAYRYYLEGKRLRRSSDGSLAASRALERAVDIEPRFAAAIAELALCHLGSAGYPAPEQPESSAHKLARRALELDPTLPEANVAAAAVAIYSDWNWDEAEALLTRGLAISPDHEYLLSYLGSLAAIQGDLERAIALVKPLVARDVTDARLHYSLGQLFYRSGRYREAIESYRLALELDATLKLAHMAIGRVRALQGDPEGAMKEMALEPLDSFRLYGLALTHIVAGNELAAKEMLQKLVEDHSQHLAYWIGTLYAYQGKSDDAFAYLELAFESHDNGLLELLTDPLLETARHDPRFGDLAARMDLQ